MLCFPVHSESGGHKNSMCLSFLQFSLNFPHTHLNAPSVIIAYNVILERGSS